MSTVLHPVRVLCWAMTENSRLLGASLPIPPVGVKSGKRDLNRKGRKGRKGRTGENEWATFGRLR